MKRRGVGSLLVVALLAGVLAAPPALLAQQRRLVTIASGWVVGVYYPLAGAMSRIAYNAKGLTIAAIRDNGPVVILEHRFLGLQAKGHVPEDAYTVRLGQAQVVRPGSDITLCGIGRTTHLCLEAAEQLAAEGDCQGSGDRGAVDRWGPRYGRGLVRGGRDGGDHGGGERSGVGGGGVRRVFAGEVRGDDREPDAAAGGRAFSVAAGAAGD